MQGNVPLKRKDRIKDLLKLKWGEKKNLLPPEGMMFQMGPCQFRVRRSIPSKLRFVAELHNVAVEDD